MNIIFTLDYELFLGENTGTVDNCLIRPMTLLTSNNSIRYTIFVDAVYLYKLNSYKDKYPTLHHDLNKICQHLKLLQSSGHDIQLHIHPHWYFSIYDGNRWVLDNEHYKLSDVPFETVSVIFKESKTFLDNLLGKKTTIFRAGGFSSQPTSLLVTLFEENGIICDSSVCPGMYYSSSHQKYNYISTPAKDLWHFKNDICKEDRCNDSILEVPISTYHLSPVFWWKYVITKLLKPVNHKLYGDGKSVKTNTESIKERLFKRSMGLATIDGYKISYFMDIYRKYKNDGHNYLCIIGHPKLSTPYSIERLKSIVDEMKRNGDMFLTISEII